MTGADDKAADAFRTIGEVAAETGLAQHVLRYWETRFPQLRPLQRAGNRRYYRPGDVALVRRIDALLNHDGYTIRGVQQLLASERAADAPAASGVSRSSLHAVRDMIARALADDRG
jgi:DNA-binding transcriptional MerR regulator